MSDENNSLVPIPRNQEEAPSEETPLSTQNTTADKPEIYWKSFLGAVWHSYVDLNSGGQLVVTITQLSALSLLFLGLFGITAFPWYISASIVLLFVFVGCFYAYRKERIQRLLAEKTIKELKSIHEGLSDEYAKFNQLLLTANEVNEKQKQKIENLEKQLEPRLKLSLVNNTVVAPYPYDGVTANCCIVRVKVENIGSVQVGAIQLKITELIWGDNSYKDYAFYPQDKFYQPGDTLENYFGLSSGESKFVDIAYRKVDDNSRTILRIGVPGGVNTSLGDDEILGLKIRLITATGIRGVETNWGDLRIDLYYEKDRFTNKEGKRVIYKKLKCRRTIRRDEEPTLLRSSKD